MTNDRRIAFYGGSFDPVHRGHLTIACALIEQFQLDEFVFLPAYHAPHKPQRTPTSAFDRYTMLCLATENDEKITVSRLEIQQPDRPYTFQTLARIEELFPNDTTYFVMGADSWAEINTWREWSTVLTRSNHIVVTRPGTEIDLMHLGGGFGEHIVDLRGGYPLPAVTGEASPGTKIYFSDAVMLPCSSTSIRHNIAAGEPAWADAVPHQVAKYIKKYQIYKQMEQIQERSLQRAVITLESESQPTPFAELDPELQLAIRCAADKKAVDLRVLDLRQIASFTEFFVIASGTNQRQVQAIADEVNERLKKELRRRPVRIEGYGAGEWVLLDYGDFIIHVFNSDSREFYDLERLWRDAGRVELPPDL